jgi:RNA polymerase sigma-70 factor, ECF subfamily
VREHQSLVYSIARHLLNAPAHAEELAQDVFLELFRNIRKIDSPAHLLHWLRRTTTNRCIDHSRKKSTRNELPIGDGVHPSAFTEVADVLLHESLRRHVGALPEWQRAVVVLRYQEDMELSEIAQTLGIPLNTVKSRLHRALEGLRDTLQARKVANA